MKSEVLMQESGPIRRSRLDLVAFAGAFGVGSSLYALLHFHYQVSQLIVTGAIVAVMVGYALAVVYVPRLRVRLDQAGDNAYYLGLLFTLVSMAAALYDFSRVPPSGDGETPGPTGAQQIIGNFGIALASTITGIFLRVILHQMRIDPAEVESMTRIELSEASKHVRAILSTVTLDLGQFHDEVRQRSSDVVTTLLEDAKRTGSSLNSEVERATHDMLASVGNAHKGVLSQTEELTRLLSGLASEALAAVERLRAVEPPPVLVSRRLANFAKVLDGAAEQTQRVASYLQGTADTVATVIAQISKVSTTLGQSAQQMQEGHKDVAQILGASVERVRAALDAVGERLEQDGQLLIQLEEQSGRSVEQSARAQAAAVEVLTRLTELTRGLIVVLKDAKVDDGYGNAH